VICPFIEALALALIILDGMMISLIAVGWSVLVSEVAEQSGGMLHLVYR
jgi:hypothetical protein